MKNATGHLGSFDVLDRNGSILGLLAADAQLAGVVRPAHEDFALGSKERRVMRPAVHRANLGPRQSLNLLRLITIPGVAQAQRAVLPVAP